MKVQTVTDRLSIIWEFDMSNEIKQNFFQTVLTLLHGGRTKYIEKKNEWMQVLYEECLYFCKFFWGEGVNEC